MMSTIKFADADSGGVMVLRDDGRPYPLPWDSLDGILARGNPDERAAWSALSRAARRWWRRGTVAMERAIRRERNPEDTGIHGMR